MSTSTKTLYINEVMRRVNLLLREVDEISELVVAWEGVVESAITNEEVQALFPDITKTHMSNGVDSLSALRTWLDADLGGGSTHQRTFDILRLPGFF